ncbi:hypothetical protein ACFPRL_32470 [Pseudoclavibacter helvolus]
MGRHGRRSDPFLSSHRAHRWKIRPGDDALGQARPVAFWKTRRDDHDQHPTAHREPAANPRPSVSR